MTLDWHSKSSRSTTDQYIGKNVDVVEHVKIKPSHTEHTSCVYEEDCPLDYLVTLMEKTILQTNVTTDIYPICVFVAQACHIDSHTCHILKQLGYSSDANGKECSKHWAMTQKLIMAHITKLCNQMLYCYQSLATGKCKQPNVCVMFVYAHHYL